MKAGDDSTEGERRGLKKLRAGFGLVVSAALDDPRWPQTFLGHPSKLSSSFLRSSSASDGLRVGVRRARSSKFGVMARKPGDG
jgi:hypothetical protein